MRRRLVIAGFVVAVIALILFGIWIGYDRPPLRLVLKYGLPPAGGPTGRTKTIAGNEFVEISPGYRYVLRDVLLENMLGLPMVPTYERNGIQNWVVMTRTFWIGERKASEELVGRLGTANSCGLDGPSLVRLSADVTGRFRLPTREELWFAAEAGALGGMEKAEVEYALLSDDSGEAVRILLGNYWASAEGPEDAMLSIGYIRRAEAYRLVWIPPEEE